MSQPSTYPYRGFRGFLLAFAARLCRLWVAAALLVACVVAFCAVLLVVTLLGSIYGLTGLVMFDWIFTHGWLLPTLMAGTPLEGSTPLLRHGGVGLLLLLLIAFAAVQAFHAVRRMAPVAAQTGSEFPSKENLA